jgi:hypothetical protein
MHEHEGSVWHQYVDLLGSAPHWLLEITIMLVFDVLIGLLLWPAVKRWIARHDDEHHHGHTSHGSTTRLLDAPVSGHEWQGLEARGSTVLEPGKRYWVRINEDSTFAIGREHGGTD